jgi:hypothetical protein
MRRGAVEPPYLWVIDVDDYLIGERENLKGERSYPSLPSGTWN